MDIEITGAVIFLCLFGGTLVAMSLRRFLPDSHLADESKDVVKLGIGVIATMSALVLSLMIASAKTAYDTRGAQIEQMSANILALDHILAEYGPEPKEIRIKLRQATEDIANRMWAAGPHDPVGHAATFANSGLYHLIRQLAPKDELQRSLQDQALKLAIELGRTRWMLLQQSASSIPMPFLILLVIWLALIFGSFGLFAPRNATVIGIMFVCTLSVAAALTLVMELDQSFAGLIQISTDPLHHAAGAIGRAEGGLAESAR